MRSNLAGRTSNTACGRCRQKKKKCDQKLPKCRLCESAGVECYAYDPLTKKPIPRSYVHDLEEQVVTLQAKLRRLEQSSIGSNGAQPPSNAGQGMPSLLSPNADADAASVAATIATHETRAANTGAVFSKALLRRLQNREAIPPASSRLNLQQLGARNATTRADTAETHSLSLGPIYLPDPEAARGLFEAYFQFANLCMPLLHETTFDNKVKLLYRLPRTIDLTHTHTSREARLAVFFVFEVMAIGILLKHTRDPLTSPLYLAQQYHELAASALDTLGVPPTVEGVQALVLLAQYLYHHPTFEGVWSAVGVSLRYAVELNLHQEPPSVMTSDPLTVDTMRKAFWVAYMLDRNVSRGLCKPMFLPDGAITVKFPSVMRDEFITTDGVNTSEAHTSASKHVALHIMRFRLIQSEMQSILYDRAPTPFKPIDLHQWQQEMRLRLDGWYNSIPARKNASGMKKTVISTFELTYKVGLVDLYRSTPNIAAPSAAQHLEAAVASAQVIRLYKDFLIEHKLTIWWLAVQCLFTAGEALLSGYVHTATVRERLSFRELQTLVQTCSSTLWGITEHFPAGIGKRDAFDTLSTEILADLGKRSMVVDGREDVDLGNEQDAVRDHQAVLSGPSQPLSDPVSESNSLLDQQQASLLLSLSNVRPFNTQGLGELSGPGHEPSTMQPPDSFQPSWGADSMAHVYDPDPTLVRYDNVDDLSMLWGGTDGFDDTLTPTWI
ncbi:fungal specific transcription factor domain-containing protein [Sarocladium implicatum]|nr:fungal specific transcription factor domain-containing protein [Sarocladium implicatum]